MSYIYICLGNATNDKELFIARDISAIILVERESRPLGFQLSLIFFSFFRCSRSRPYPRRVSFRTPSSSLSAPAGGSGRWVCSNRRVLRRGAL